VTRRGLEEALKRRAVERNGILLLRPRDALEIVRQARNNGIPVLGLDGFHLSEAGIQPDLGHSVDFSLSADTQRESWRHAEAFIEARMGQDLYFEVVLD